jgi:UDPglucose 6-dehydrogenase
VQALIRTADSIGFDAHLLRAVEARNNSQKTVLFSKIQRHFAGELSGKVFALWGLAFKPNTDDMRDAPSRTLMEALWAAGASVQAYDPEAMEATRQLYPDNPHLSLCESKEAALQKADALIIITEWRQFKAPDFAQLKLALKDALIFDGRNLFEPQRMRAKGFQYYAIGRT